MYSVLYYLALTFAYLYISFFKSNKKTLGGPLPCTLKSKQRFEKNLTNAHFHSIAWPNRAVVALAPSSGGTQQCNAT
jgi:hypothetical protein